MCCQRQENYYHLCISLHVHTPNKLDIGSRLGPEQCPLVGRRAAGVRSSREILLRLLVYIIIKDKNDAARNVL